MVYQQTRRWITAGLFEAMTHDQGRTTAASLDLRVREVMRFGQARKKRPSGVVLDARVLKSSVESGHRAGWDGYRVKGSKIHIAVDGLGQLMAAVVTAASENERRQAEGLAKRVQEVTGEAVEVAWVDQG